MEPIFELVVAAAFAYFLLVGVFYLGARVHFESMSRWRRAAEEQLDQVRLQLDEITRATGSQALCEVPSEETELSWTGASFDLGGR